MSSLNPASVRFHAVVALIDAGTELARRLESASSPEERFGVSVALEFMSQAASDLTPLPPPEPEPGAESPEDGVRRGASLLLLDVVEDLTGRADAAASIVDAAAATLARDRVAWMIPALFPTDELLPGETPAPVADVMALARARRVLDGLHRSQRRRSAIPDNLIELLRGEDGDS